MSGSDEHGGRASSKGLRYTAIINPLRWRDGDQRARVGMLVEYIEAEILPLAIEFGLIDQCSSLQELARQRWQLTWVPELQERVKARRESRASNLQSATLTPETRVYFGELLGEQLMLLHSLVAGLQKRERTGGSVPDLLDAALFRCLTWAGWLNGMKSSRTVSTTPAREKRKEIGARSRKRVEAAASTYRGKVSREKAALKMSQTIGMEPSTIRKVLSELYPGDSWGEQFDNSSGTTDKS